MNWFSRTPVHQRVRTFFNSVLSHNRLAHAYLLYGAESAGMSGFALELAAALNCQSETERPCGQCAACRKTARLNHPDVKYLFPAPKAVYDTPKKFLELLKYRAEHPYRVLPVGGTQNIPIDAVRGLKDEAKYAPFEGGYRVFIIECVEYMSREAANSFLKLLEEPPDRLLLILITQDIHALLDTIRSRCQPVYFPAPTMEQVRAILLKEKPDAEISDALIASMEYNPDRILHALDHPEESFAEEATQFLRGAVSGNWTILHPVIDKVLQKKDKQILYRFLDALTHWLADAFHHALIAEEASLFLETEAEASRRFAEAYTRLDYDNAMQLIHNTRAMLEQNARPEMALSRLAIDLQNTIRAAR